MAEKQERVSAADVRELRKKNMPRRGLNHIEAAVYVGVGVAKFLSFVKDGRMPAPRKFDGASVWDVLELDIFFEAFPRSDVETSDTDAWGNKKPSEWGKT